MNIFLLDYNVELCAQYHCDKHVVKMMLEYAQLLSTACRHTGLDIGYKSTHVNHPSALWARESRANWLYLRSLYYAVHEEWQFRFDHTDVSKSYPIVKSLPEPELESRLGLTDFKLAMPDEYKQDSPVLSYREYYMRDKQHIAQWTKRDVPYWYEVTL